MRRPASILAIMILVTASWLFMSPAVTQAVPLKWTILDAEFPAATPPEVQGWFIYDAVTNTLGDYLITTGEDLPYFQAAHYSSVDPGDQAYVGHSVGLGAFDLLLNFDDYGSTSSVLQGLSIGFYDPILSDAGGTHLAYMREFNPAYFIGPDIAERSPNEAYVFSNGAPVPEPTTGLLMCVGLIGLAGLWRKFRKK